MHTKFCFTCFRTFLPSLILILILIIYISSINFFHCHINCFNRYIFIYILVISVVITIYLSNFSSTVWIIFNNDTVRWKNYLSGHFFIIICFISILLENIVCIFFSLYFSSSIWIVVQNFKMADGTASRPKRAHSHRSEIKDWPSDHVTKKTNKEKIKELDWIES